MKCITILYWITWDENNVICNYVLREMFLQLFTLLLLELILLAIQQIFMLHCKTHSFSLIFQGCVTKQKYKISKQHFFCTLLTYFYCPLIFKAGPFIFEAYQYGQEWLPFGELIVTAPNGLLLLFETRNSFQFHHTSRDGSEACRFVVLQVLLVFTEDRNDI